MLIFDKNLINIIFNCTYINYTYKTSLIYIHRCIYITNFAKDVQMVPKCVSRWESTMNPFLMGCQIKLWSIHVQMGVLEAVGSDVPNLMKDVPNFVKNVPRVRKCIPKWGLTPNHLLMGF